MNTPSKNYLKSYRSKKTIQNNIYSTFFFKNQSKEKKKQNLNYSPISPIDSLVFLLDSDARSSEFSFSSFFFLLSSLSSSFPFLFFFSCF